MQIPDFASALRAGGVVSNLPLRRLSGLVGGTLEQQVESLKQNIGQLWRDHAQLDQRMTAETTAFREALERERAQRVAEVSGVRDLVHTSQAEGIHVSIFGVACVMVGLIYGTASPEIVKLVEWFMG